ncbi:hypothetical protein [Neobacillus sp. D3-1R]
MSMWWITTIGFIICLGFFGGIFVYALRNALPTEDSTRIDPLPEDTDLTQ